MTTIKCPQCNTEIELTEALKKDIEKTVLAAEHAKHVAELEQVKKEAADNAAKSIAEAEEKAKADAAAKLDIKFQALEKEAEETTKDNKELREQLSTLMQELRESKKATENAELEMQKKLAEEETKIREEAQKTADEKQRLNLATRDKTIADLQKALDEAQRKAAQGSQQLQGEVLELDLESRLKECFPLDEIIEVKKGQKGADIKQIVNNSLGASCGCILWETKNAKWQPSWIKKFKNDIREANAHVGVLVSQEIPKDIGELNQIENNIWVVTPSLAPPLATALRSTILQVGSANKMHVSKDEKMEILYQFLVGPEFKHRIDAIIESYSLLQKELEKEKRAFALKWAREEKAIRSVMDNTIGMYGDLQGITNRALPTIKNLELDSGESED
jgi:hypothetical protein